MLLSVQNILLEAAEMIDYLAESEHHERCHGYPIGQGKDKDCPHVKCLALAEKMRTTAKELLK